MHCEVATFRKLPRAITVGRPRSGNFAAGPRFSPCRPTCVHSGHNSPRGPGSPQFGSTAIVQHLLPRHRGTRYRADAGSIAESTCELRTGRGLERVQTETLNTVLHIVPHESPDSDLSAHPSWSPRPRPKTRGGSLRDARHAGGCPVGSPAPRCRASRSTTLGARAGSAPRAGTRRVGVGEWWRRRPDLVEDP